MDYLKIQPTLHLLPNLLLDVLHTWALLGELAPAPLSPAGLLLPAGDC